VVGLRKSQVINIPNKEVDGDTQIVKQQPSFIKNERKTQVGQYTQESGWLQQDSSRALIS
jgi:hypothetical protein